MPSFKRDNELIESVKQIAETISNDNGERDAILKLVKSYEYVTFKEWKDKPKFTCDTFDSFTNDFGFADDAVAETMANNHPTLQQSFMAMCLKFIKRMAEKKYVDDRNRLSVEKAKKMIAAIEGETGLPCI